MAECYMNGIGNNIIVEKNVDKKNAVLGDILTYSITVINQGDLAVGDLVVIDTLPSELEFVEGSVVVGTQPLPKDNIVSGVNIGCLAAGAIKTLLFKAKIIDRPFSGCITNTAFVKFSGVNMADNSILCMDTTSNTVCVSVDIAEVKVIKKTEAKIISRGDEVRFFVKVINTGTLEARNILFTDIIPEKDIFIQDTFRVNGQHASVAIKTIPGVGRQLQLYIGSIAPTEEVIITYKVKIVSVGCKCQFTNKAYATFSYNLPGCVCDEKTSKIDEDSMSEVEVGLSTFKQLSIDGYLPIPDAKPNIEEINVMTATADLISYHVIETPVAKSAEGQILSGYKLILKGMLNEVIEYTANEPTQSVHSAHYAIPFSTFIVLPSDFKIGSKIEVNFIIEDIYYKAIDIRNLFKNITLLVNVKVLCC